MRPAPRGPGHLLAAWGATLLGACAAAPTYLRGSGPVADAEARLGWLLLAISLVVVVVISGLVVAGIYRRRRSGDPDTGASATIAPGGALETGHNGLAWVVVGGVIVPTLILAVVLVLNTRTLAAVVRAPAADSVSIEVTGHRWWWEVRYAGAEPEDIFTTANEIHVPVGRPVTLRLRTADVIHSFWIPQLAGKLDLIPGQTNELTFQADSPGAYWGHCGEYCGLQHAGMMMSVVADPPARYARWLEGQRRPATTPPDSDAAAGAQVFATTGCAVCHAIRGTDAGGAIGPDLTHLASRRLIAAGMLPNSPGTLVGWIADPQAFKPGVAMPRVPLTADQVRQVAAYLQTLR